MALALLLAPSFALADDKGEGKRIAAVHSLDEESLLQIVADTQVSPFGRLLDGSMALDEKLAKVDSN